MWIRLGVTAGTEGFARLCRARERLRESESPLPSVRELAHEAGFSTTAFIRRFAALFGCTPHRFRTHARIERARRLLATQDLNITDVCLDVGCTSLGSFSTRFASRVGMSPVAYRRAIRERATLPASSPRSPWPGCMALLEGALAVGAERKRNSGEDPAPAVPAHCGRTDTGVLPCESS
jgi:AraC-like DNA-binding protein